MRNDVSAYSAGALASCRARNRRVWLKQQDDELSDVATVAWREMEKIGERAKASITAASISGTGLLLKVDYQ